MTAPACWFPTLVAHSVRSVVQTRLFEESCLSAKSGKWLRLGRERKGRFYFRQILVLVDGATLIAHAMKRAAVRDLMVGPTGCTGQEFPKLALSPKLSSI